MKNNFKKAFSLIEISVVILMIGMIIAAMSRSLSLTNEAARLATARALTSKAPVGSIDNLELWLEATSQESLAIGTTTFANIKNPEDGQAIGRWNDLNPRLINPSDKNHATQITLAYQPLYKQNAINDLPALLFDGIDDYIASTTKSSILNSFTIFFVALPTASITVNAESNVSTTGTGGQKYINYPQHGDFAIDRSILNYCYSCVSGSGVSLGNNGIATYEHSHSYMPPYISKSLTIKKPIQFTLKYKNKVPNIYINSVSSYTSSWASSRDVFPGLTFGGGRPCCGENYGYYKGYIGEIIVYSTDLNDADRKLIEAYLIEKWRIKL